MQKHEQNDTNDALDQKNEPLQHNEDSAALAKIRERIDLLDEAILELLQQRACLAKAVATAKQQSVCYRPEREAEVLERLYASNAKQNANLADIGCKQEKPSPQGQNTSQHIGQTKLNKEFFNALVADENVHIPRLPLENRHIKGIWTEIFSSSRAIQQKLSVAYLGPEGTFSYFAGKEVFGSAMDFVPCKDFADVFDSVHRQDCHYGFVPLENSQQGSVGQCLDLFDTYPVNIVGEHYSSICQCLLSTEDRLEDIQEVFSHPQALMQSHDWLKIHLPHAKHTHMSSTADAAQRALREKGTAVIGHENLSQLISVGNDFKQGDSKKRLAVLSKDIAKDKNNRTRFVVISAYEDIKTLSSRVFLKPKSSMTFSLPDKAGALSDMLNHFRKYDINLTKLESRPLYRRIKKDTWEYRFFADAHINLWQKNNLAKELAEFCSDFRILGVYEENH